ncbi:hypothetical protein OCU04_008970 [Sclerotinia nivalis]|uniref:Uncharacterized protein n=1 Tax=Sclerotinia nivalis TaxID=352851 RepID=A0A9X0DH92_9HELO|nr:hypothetical protein OCU04_008970 [Sclerotinia nivalis]
MNGWMKGRLVGWMDGWMDGWIDGWINGWVDDQIVELMVNVPRAADAKGLWGFVSKHFKTAEGVQQIFSWFMILETKRKKMFSIRSYNIWEGGAAVLTTITWSCIAHGR